MKTKWFLRAFALIAAIPFASCGDKDKEVMPGFPDSVPHTIAAGETMELTFTADADWTLSSGETWCVFVDGGEERMQKIGQAGTVTVTVKVKDTNHTFEEVSADIDLVLRGQKKTVFVITRPGKERRVTLYKREGGAYSEIPQVELTFSNGRTTPLQIGFTANFDWKVFSKTEGIVLGTDLSGTANQAISDAEFKSSYVSLPVELLSDAFSGVIEISDLNGENRTSFAVTYGGMGEEDLFFSAAHLRAGFDASVNFSNQGYLMSKEAVPQPTEELSFSFTAVTRGMKSAGYVVSFDGATAQIAANPWLVLTSDGNGGYTVAVEGNGVNPGEARSLHVFILPEALASATPDFSPYFANGQSKGIYTFQVAQEAAPVEGLDFFIGWGWMQTPVAEGKVVSFSEHPFFSDITPGDMGLPNHKTYVYEFSNSDVNGQLAVAPLGISFDNLLYNLQNTEAWPEISREGMWIEATGGMGVAVNSIKSDVSGARMMFVKFYESQSDKDADNPASVLILRQVP